MADFCTQHNVYFAQQARVFSVTYGDNIKKDGLKPVRFLLFTLAKAPLFVTVALLVILEENPLGPLVTHFLAMKTHILLTCFLPSMGWGQETALRNPWKAAPLEIPEAVAKARVQARTVIKGTGGQDGGNLIVEVIEVPVLVAPAQPVAQSVAPLGEEELAARAARRATEPNEFRLFSPTVVIFDNDISLVRWWTADRKTGYQEYSAWVKLDLSSINACGDLTVGRTRYCMLSMVHRATDRFAGQFTPPALTDFKQHTDIILTSGDLENQEAMRPLMALLAKYDTEGEQIEATAAAIKADQEARLAWEAAHPEPQADTVIKFWPVESTEYSTNPVK